MSLSISRRITGTLAPHLRDASEGLAEVFCLTDPSRAGEQHLTFIQCLTIFCLRRSRDRTNFGLQTILLFLPQKVRRIVVTLFSTRPNFKFEEFNRTTQYGLSYVLGRNCRFLQGPRTNPLSVDRLRAAVANGQELCEVFLN